MLFASQIKYNRCIDLLQPCSDNPHTKTLYPQIYTQRRKASKERKANYKVKGNSEKLAVFLLNLLPSHC